MEHDLKYIAKEYRHGWSLWLEKDGKKIQLGTAIESEKKIKKLVESIPLEKEYLTKEEQLLIEFKAMNGACTPNTEFGKSAIERRKGFLAALDILGVKVEGVNV